MNRLQHETSPYLLQHRDNPVDWYPWGEDAFAKAQADDKPVLLSVGYSACHWCHVMAHESFEHGPTADFMNEHFINVKVDREERPDVDDIYMTAVQIFNRGQGGWPMTVFLTPQGVPFHGGTYYPRESRFGMPSFKQVMDAVLDAYRHRREAIDEQSAQIQDALQRDLRDIGGDASQLNADLLHQAAAGLRQNFDKMYGGFGQQPKFPQPMTFEYLLRHHARTGDAESLHVVTLSLDKMATGGIYDQIGGGFHRYSVDRYWLVPHFEKMLYDNAQLSRLYLHAYQVTGEPFYRRIAEEIYDYILREMTAPEGGFYSATDADSEGEEGKFFVWTLDEIEAALAPLTEAIPDAYDIAVEAWGLTRSGNFEGKNILSLPNEDATTAKRLGLSVDELHEKLTRIKDQLYAMRANRVAPGLDDKVLTAWSAMMMASLAEAARVLERDDYLTAAERCGEFILTHLTAEDGRLWRSFKQGQAKFNAYLEDYANLIDAYLELYQANFVEKWFVEARRLADYVLDHFSAEEGGFYDTSDDHEKLIVRPRAVQDNAVPSGNAMMAKQLLRLVAYTGEGRYDDAARGMLRLLVGAMQQYPQAFAESLNAVDMLVSGLAEIAVVGNPAQSATRSLLKVIRQPYRPNLIAALSRDEVEGEATIPLLSYRTRKGDAPTVYVCRNFACRFPVTTPAEVEQLLSEAT